MILDKPVNITKHYKTNGSCVGQGLIRKQRIERWVNKENTFFQVDRVLNTKLFQLGEQREKLIKQHNYHQKIFANKQALRHKDNESILNTLNYVRKCCKHFDEDNSTQSLEENSTMKINRSRSSITNVPKSKRNSSLNTNRQSNSSLTDMFVQHNKKHIQSLRKMSSSTVPIKDEDNQSRHVQFQTNIERNIQSAYVSRKVDSLNTKQYNRNVTSAHNDLQIPTMNSLSLITTIDNKEEKPIKPKIYSSKNLLQEFRQHPERYLSKTNRYLPLLRRQAMKNRSQESSTKIPVQHLSTVCPLNDGSDIAYDDAKSFLSEEIEIKKTTVSSHNANRQIKTKFHVPTKIDLMETDIIETSEYRIALSRARDREYNHLNNLIHTTKSIEHILEPLSTMKTKQEKKSTCFNDVLYSIDSLHCSTTFKNAKRRQNELEKNLSKLSDDGDTSRKHSYVDDTEAALLNDRTNVIPMTSISTDTSIQEHSKKQKNTTVVNVLTTTNKSNQIRTEGREQWSEKLDFLLSIIGFAVDLANIWRFPYLCYKNGGGAFLIPYVLSVILGGMPLFYLELLLGQYYRQGAITCWKKICPLLAGIGWAVTIIAFYTDFYYNVVISWGLYYLFASFKRMLPWSGCNNPWNTKDCSTVNTRRDFMDNCTSYLNSTINSTGELLESNFIYENCSQQLTQLRIVSPAQEYFHLQVYRLKPERNLSLSNLGSINWENLACLGIIYIICYFSMWKGVKTSGKVVWFTALFPYFVLTILMVRGLFLNGSMKGIEYYIRPDLSKLNDAGVWVDAASQTFFSLGPGFGVLMAFASYNDFHHNVYRDAMITVAVNSITSFASGFVIFMFLGYMSEISGREIKDVAEQGSTLVFIVYPEAIATMPWAPLWAIFFFLMLLTLGLDSSFGGSEAIITALSDVFPVLRRHRELFVGVLFTFYFIIGIPSCTDAGVYFVELLQNYAAFYSIIIAVLFEAIAVSWLYGINRISEDVKEMLGSKPGKFWIITWCLIAPLFLGGIVLSGLIQHVAPNYGKLTDPYYHQYPDWSHLVGWMFALSSVIFIPVVAIYQLLMERGSLSTRFRLAITPWKEREKHVNPDIVISTNFIETHNTSDETN
ncbi:unnamed protein product [Adineta steineri]|uniref:Transporter n=1 Tax=Adineta steineri TaxID=433720 RepID=A0A814YCN7_9BILA|nr:unnamed protein product [Adineta steineri]